MNTFLAAFAVAQTLTATQVMDKLRVVPVFVVTNAAGSPITATLAKQRPAVGVFIRRQDADQFMSLAKKNDPKMGEMLRVTAVTLADMVKQATLLRETTDIAFIPSQAEVMIAKELLKAAGKPEKTFQGTPLYLIRVKGQGFLTVTQGPQSVVPSFFVCSEAQAMIDQVKKAKPEMVLSLDVTTLENMIQLLNTAKEPDIAKIVLVPAKEAMAAVLPPPAKAPDKP